MSNSGKNSMRIIPPLALRSAVMAAASSSMPQSSSSKDHNYSRKLKSLGLLCTKFLSLYDSHGDHSIGLDDAASKLGVERRRIYDIVNVLESVGVLARKGKRQYIWKGYGAIPAALQELKEEGMNDNCYGSDANDGTRVSDDEDDDEEGCTNPNTGSQNLINTSSKSSGSTKNDNRREKSLALLAQNFVKLFVCSSVDLISLDDAAKLLIGDVNSSALMRTKVRRLYDIANVLSSMALIEKTYTSARRKPAFRWLGLRGQYKDESAFSVLPPESVKRKFGTDMTNMSCKTSRIGSSMGQSATWNSNMQKQLKKNNFPTEVDENYLERECIEGQRSYQFGPFAPAAMAKVGVSNNTYNVNTVHDWNNLASTYRPQYQNQALQQLFDHYSEAWKSWFSEAAKKPI